MNVMASQSVFHKACHHIIYVPKNPSSLYFVLVCDHVRLNYQNYICAQSILVNKQPNKTVIPIKQILCKESKAKPKNNTIGNYVIL